MTQDIQIFIDNFRVDIGKTSAIQIKKQFKDVKEFSKKKTSFTKPINVLFTQNNSYLFGSAFNINTVGGWDKNSRPSARIMVGGVVVLEGLAKLDSITGSYGFIVYKDEVNLTAALNDELIRGNANASKDVSFTNQYSFNFTRPNLRALMQSSPRTDGKGINYGYADFFGDQEYENDRLFVPSIAAKELIEEVVLSIGKTITFSTEVLTYLNSLYIPFNGEISEISNRWKFAKHTAYSPDTNLDRFGGKPIGNWRVDFDKIEDESNIERGSVITFSPNEAIGSYEITLTLTAFSFGTSTENEIMTPHVKVFNFATQESDEIKMINVANPDRTDMTIPAGQSSATSTFKGTYSLNAPVESGMYLTYDVTNDIFTTETFGSTFIELEKLDSFYNEDAPNVITADKILPLDYKKIDLFNDIMLLFNGVATQDESNIHIETSNEFSINASGVNRDWSDLIDESSIQISTLLAKKAEILSYQMSESDDKFTDDYKNQFDSGMFDLNRIDNNKSVIKKSTVFANTARINNYSALNNDKESLSTRLKPRLLFINSVNIAPMQFGRDNRGARDTSITNLHVLSNRFKEDTTAADNLALAFNNEFTYSDNALLRKGTNGTIYNRFHKGEENLMVNDDAIILTANFYLSDKDFGEVNFNDVIFINTDRYGAANYRLNEISRHYVGLNKLSKVELIQIDLNDLDYDFTASEIDLTQVFLQPEN